MSFALHHLCQVVEDFLINVRINESLPIKNLHVPIFKTDPNSISDPNVENHEAEITKDKMSAVISYKPTLHNQKRFIKTLWTGKDRLSGQLIVEYDVDRSDGNEIQVLVKLSFLDRSSIEF
jgi:hypothetical protein